MATFNKRPGANKLPAKQALRRGPEAFILPAALQRLASTQYVNKSDAIGYAPVSPFTAGAVSPDAPYLWGPVPNPYTFQASQVGQPRLDPTRGAGLPPGSLGVTYRGGLAGAPPVTAPGGTLPGRYGQDAAGVLRESANKLTVIGSGLTAGANEARAAIGSVGAGAREVSGKASGIAQGVQGRQATARESGAMYDALATSREQVESYNNEARAQRAEIEGGIKDRAAKRALTLAEMQAKLKPPVHRVAELGQRELQTVGLIAAIGAALGASHDVVLNALNMYGQGRLQGLQSQYDAQYQADVAAYEQTLGGYKEAIDSLAHQDSMAVQMMNTLPRTLPMPDLNPTELRAGIIGAYLRDLESGTDKEQALERLVNTLVFHKMDPFLEGEEVALKALTLSLKGDTEARRAAESVWQIDRDAARILVGMEQDARDAMLDWIASAQSEEEKNYRAQQVATRIRESAPGSNANIEESLKADHEAAAKSYEDARKEAVKAFGSVNVAERVAVPGVRTRGGSLSVALDGGKWVVRADKPNFEPVKGVGGDKTPEQRAQAVAEAEAQWQRLLSDAERTAADLNRMKGDVDAKFERLQNWRGPKPQSVPQGGGRPSPLPLGDPQATVADQIAGLMGDDFA